MEEPIQKQVAGYEDLHAKLQSLVRKYGAPQTPVSELDAEIQRVQEAVRVLTFQSRF